MTNEKPGAGRPPKYHRLIAQLQDDRLYSCSSIVQLLRNATRLEKTRLLSALIQRSTMHGLRPDGKLAAPRGKAPAYLGKHWKETIDPAYLKASNMERPQVRNVDLPPIEGCRRRGYPMKYDNFIRHLEPFRLYGPKEVAEQGSKKDLLSRAQPERMAGEKLKVEHSARAFSTRLPDPPDKIEEVSPNRTRSLWYGWRWQMGLSDSVFSKEERARLERRVRWRGRFGSPKVWSVGFLFLAFLAFTWALGPNRLVEGYDILWQRGPGAAYEYFLSSSQKTDSDQFGSGWAAFQIGKYDEAAAVAQALLSRADPESKLAGDCHYLLGNIHYRTGDLETAQVSLLLAEKTYGHLNLEPALHLTYCSLGNLALGQMKRYHDRQKLDEADKYFQRAQAIGKPTGVFYHLASQIAFEKGDFESAMNASEQGVQAFEGNPTFQARGYSDLGFYRMLNGQFDRGMDATLQAQILIVKTADEAQYYYNLINEILYKKCHGESMEILVSLVEKAIEARQDQRLANYLDSVLDLDCADLRVSDGTPLPPPPKDGGGGKRPQPPG